MSYIVYSATSLESFLKRKVERNDEVFYFKKKHKGLLYDDISYTSDFHVSYDRAMNRKRNKKIPLIMTFETDHPNGKLPGDIEHRVLELWAYKHWLPKNIPTHTGTEKYGFYWYNPKHLMRIMDSYELMGGIFIKKE